MDGTYMTNGELAAMQVESSLRKRVSELERRVDALTNLLTELLKEKEVNRISRMRKS